MSEKVKDRRLKVSNFKLNSLLNITKAINENLSRNDLLKRYEQILRGSLNIGKIVMFKYENDAWECVISAGYKKNASQIINVDEDLITFNEISFISSDSSEALEDFDIVIPVIINNTPQAFVLIGDIDEEKAGVSPVIKHLHFIQTLSNIIIVAIENMRLFRDSIKQERMKKELELATKMQNMLIPDSSILPKNEHMYVAAYYRPHFEIGGDYYDVIELDKDEIGFCVADVSGKGISAALLMSNFQANLRALFTHEISLADLAGILNNRIMQSVKGEKFITLFAGRYNSTTRILEYINAGHNPPILYDVKKKNLSFLKDGCAGLGMLDEIPIIKKGVIEINNKSKLICFTDGLIEILNETGVETGTKLIEKEIANANSIEETIKNIIEGYNAHKSSDMIFDDVTILGVEMFE